MAEARSFTAVVTTDGKRRVLVPVPFEPDEAWGAKPQHHVAGTVDGMAVRAVIEPLGDGRAILLGPAWRRGCGIAPGDEVDVVLARGPAARRPRGRRRRRARGGAGGGGVLRLARAVLPTRVPALDRRDEAAARRAG